MSAKAETLAAPARPIASSVVALLLTLAIGAAGGSLITRAVTSDTTPVVAEQVAGITLWDQQKLDAMEGRQQAETVEADGPGIPAWDQGMLDAIDGFQASAGRQGNA